LQSILAFHRNLQPAEVYMIWKYY